jgi:hypothetical protein
MFSGQFSVALDVASYHPKRIRLEPKFGPKIIEVNATKPLPISDTR